MNQESPVPVEPISASLPSSRAAELDDVDTTVQANMTGRANPTASSQPPKVTSISFRGSQHAETPPKEGTEDVNQTQISKSGTTMSAVEERTNSAITWSLAAVGLAVVLTVSFCIVTKVASALRNQRRAPREKLKKATVVETPLPLTFDSVVCVVADCSSDNASLSTSASSQGQPPVKKVMGDEVRRVQKH